jgi:hypothetical protein
MLCCVLVTRTCTWLSFDGGFTWSDIAEGTWIYEYADWGGLVVMSKHELNGPADEVCALRSFGPVLSSAMATGTLCMHGGTPQDKACPMMLQTWCAGGCLS